MADDEAAVKGVLASVLTGLDDEIVDYLCSMISDNLSMEGEELVETVGPFLLSTEAAADDDQVVEFCSQIATGLSKIGGGTPSASKDEDMSTTTRLLDAPVSLAQSTDADNELMNFMWGFEKVRRDRNEEKDAEVVMNRKEARALKKAGDVEPRDAVEEEESEEELVLPDFSSQNRETDIHVASFGINFNSLELLRDASLRLVHGRRYGLIGKNGIGKTTLLRHMARFAIEGFPRHHRVLHVKQEVAPSEQSVLATVMGADRERTALLREEKELLARQQEAGESVSDEEAEQQQQQLQRIYARLRDIGSDGMEAQAAIILRGLGFSEEMIGGPTSALSGGWRMRVAIAGALLITPDLLMLDEPTNHLDLEAVLWLQNYLLTYPHTLLIVSHDRAFLNRVITDVIHFHNQKLIYYRGDYNSFEAVRNDKQKTIRREYEAQLDKRRHMQEFIDRFRCSASRAALVQSRIKALAKLPELVEPEEETDFRFQFPSPEPIGRPVVQIAEVSFNYPSAPVLFSGVNMGIDMDTRIAVLGPNGCGKSTLMKLLLQKLQPSVGDVIHNQKLRVSVFTQYHADLLDLTATPLSHLLATFPQLKEQDARDYLGRFHVSGDLSTQRMSKLSGGQKSRVAFALLLFRNPHILVMDEPTNHLDIETIDALIASLKNFAGGVVVVSHDQHFVSQVCSELWVVGGGKVNRFRGSFDEYKRAFITKLNANSLPPPPAGH